MPNESEESWTCEGGRGLFGYVRCDVMGHDTVPTHKVEGLGGLDDVVPTYLMLVDVCS